MIKSTKIILFAVIAVLMLFPKQVNAQWINIGQSDKGETSFISNRYYTLRERPYIRIFHSKTSNDSSDFKGRLVAVNCRNYSFTFEVKKNGNETTLPDDQEWYFYGIGTMGERMVNRGCS
jgi:hypothetical protein